MRLVDLNPRFVGGGGEGVSQADGTPAPLREGLGVILTCPCGTCDVELYVPFTNPLDGGPPYEGHPTWARSGETFDTLSLTPSILRNKAKGGCGWHGYITNGEIVSC